MDAHNRRPAEVFSPLDTIRAELAARGWTAEDFDRRVGAPPYWTWALLTLDDDNPSIEPIAHVLGRGFGTGPEFWLNLDRAWRAHRQR